MAYPSAASLVAASSVAELTSLDTDQQDSLRASAIIAVENFCNQSFTEESTTLQVRSEGTCEIPLPRRLEELVSMSVGGVPVDDTSNVETSDDGSHLLFVQPSSNYYSQALFEVSGGDYPRAFSRGLLSVEGTWGWADPPDAVALALRYDMEDSALADSNALSPTVRVAQKLGLSHVSQGGLALTLATRVTLTDRVERLLKGYVWTSGGRVA